MDTAEFEALLSAADVPYRFWKTKLSEQDSLERLRAYFVPGSGPFEGDYVDGLGAVFHNNTSKYNSLGPLASRTMVLYRKEIVYAELSSIIEDRDDSDSERSLYTTAYEADGLVIDQFYQHATECPYDARQRRIIESLIRTRINAKKPTFFVSTHEIMCATPWWSPAILWLIAENTREIAV